jgi:hypothetical protein
MRKNNFIIFGLLLLIALSAATTTMQPSKSDILKADWNRTICIALRVLQILSVGIAALLVMVAGLKYMSSEDVNDRNDAKDMILRVLSILVVIAIAAQVVNYLVAGTNIGSIDTESCNDLFPTTTRIVGPTTTPTIATTTTLGNGTTTTTTTVSTTSSTTTTTLGSCDDPSNPYGIYGSINSCQRATNLYQGDPKSCIRDALGQGKPDLDTALGDGFTQCCCAAAYPSCCP